MRASGTDADAARPKSPSAYAPDPVEYVLTTETKLATFVRRVLEASGVSAADAATVAEVLVAADLRGVESHGVARLDAYYVRRLRAGEMEPADRTTVVRETPSTIAFDAGNGLGHPAGVRAMRAAIERARTTGAGFATVSHSNHFGIAGFYAMLALEHDMIGIASTNSVRYGAATFGRDVMLGTNPWAYAVPAAREPAFVLDFATTTVARGKLEVYERKERPLEPGWATDAAGRETRSARAGLDGALLPLGGIGVAGGGHKGYGLGLLADLMCGVLAGGAFGTDLPRSTDPAQRGKISHFFGALRVDAFRDARDFKADVDAELRAFKDSAKAPGCDRIYVAGEIEAEKTAYHRAHGVPVHRKVWTSLERLSQELAIPFELGR